MKFRYIPAIIAACLISSPAQPASPIKIDALLFSLLQVQDRIARGDAAALPLQKHLMTMLDAGISESGKVADMSPAEFRSLIIFGIVGSNSESVIEALSEVEEPKEKLQLARAVIDYRARKRNQASKRFAKIKTNELDQRLVPYVAFAKGNLYSRVSPRRAIRQYDLVRLEAPGTLLEEASLRRLMALHASYGQGKEFSALAKQYARRFINSPYRKQFLSMLRGGVLKMRRTIPLEEVRELGELMPPAYAIALHMHLVRAALQSGHMKLAQFSITQIGMLSVQKNDSPVNQEQLRLFNLLTKMTAQDPHTLLKQLDSLDETRLAAVDIKLLERARGILGYIVAPIDEMKTNSTTVNGAKAQGDLSKNGPSDGEVSPGPSSSVIEEVEKNQVEIDQFIGSIQKRLTDIDSLLSK